MAKLNRIDRIYLERELRDYDRTKQKWEELQDEITNSRTNTPDDYMQKLGLEVTERHNSTTESKAFRLITNTRLEKLERTIKSFERVLTNLQEEKFRLVVMKYWTCPQTLTDDGIALELHCSRATLYNWLDGILIALAKEMGMID